MTSQKTFFFAFQHFEYHRSVGHDEKHPQPKFGMDRFMGPEIWPYEYLIIHIENQYKLEWFITVMNQANLHCFQWG